MNRFFSTVTVVIAGLACLASQAVPAWAGPATTCVPGLPCVVDATPNDPLNQDDGPSAPGAPNVDKLERTLTVSTGPNDPAIPVACDADFMNQIYAKSFLNANRDSLLSQTYIRKPDSVLEYTCFDRFVRQAGPILGPMFSESTRWQNIQFPINSEIGFPLRNIANVDFNVFMGARLVNDLNRLVLRSLDQYLTQNFSNSFLGGESTITTSCNAGVVDYACQFMNDVWFLAQCSQFGTDEMAFTTGSTGEPGNAGAHPFMEFRELVSADPRTLPLACPAAAAGGSPTGITQDYIDVARNLNNRFVLMDQDSTTYMNFRLTPGGPAPAPPSCLPPIPTGMYVVREVKTVDNLGNVTVTSSTGYQDKFCPNPSCYYDNSADRCQR